jgi:hypothetical protein
MIRSFISSLIQKIETLLRKYRKNRRLANDSYLTGGKGRG